VQYETSIIKTFEQNCSSAGLPLTTHRAKDHRIGFQDCIRNSQDVVKPSRKLLERVAGHLRFQQWHIGIGTAQFGKVSLGHFIVVSRIYLVWGTPALTGQTRPT
jgi:hypothetical protein